MKLTMRRVIGIAVALMIVAAFSPTAVWGADAAAGKAVYTTKCKSCHGVDGAGNPAIAKAMKVELKALGSTTADVKDVVTKGQGKMKPVASVSGADLDNVVAYVKTLKK